MNALIHNIIETDEYIENAIKEHKFLMNFTSTLTDPLSILCTLPTNAGNRVSLSKLVTNKMYYGKCNCSHHNNGVNPYWIFSLDVIQPRPDKYYNFKVNQLVHFDHILKNRTFKIK